MKKSKTSLVVVIVALLVVAAVVIAFVVPALKNGNAAEPSPTVSDAAPSPSESAEPSPSAEVSASPEPSETPEAVSPSPDVPEEPSLPDALPLTFYLTSGAGGWGTELTLNSDGTFTGVFHNTEMGEMGDDYPNGTVYTSVFSGSFKDMKKLDDSSYSMTLDEVNVDGTIDEERIEDGIRYVTAAAYGLDTGSEFILYTPETPFEGLSDQFLMWMQTDRSGKTTLDQYGLFNVGGEFGFFTGE